MPTPRPAGRRGPPIAGTIAAAGLLALIAGCAGPIREVTEAELRRSVMDAVQRELAEPSNSPEVRSADRDANVRELRLSDERLAELNERSGPGSYTADASELPLQRDLLDRPQRVVSISLERSIRSAVDQNLSVQFAQLTPAISEAQVVAAEAAFDWVLFADAEFSETDQPNPATATLTPEESATSNETQTYTGGLRRTLTSGGTLTLQQVLTESDNRARDDVDPNPANRVAISAALTQPLLQGAGSDVALATVRLSRNAERSAVASYQAELLNLIEQVEQAYWDLYVAHGALKIQQRLLERGIAVRDQVRERQLLDATPAQVADASARVESRRGDVLRAQTSLRDASRRLQVLINDPDLTVGSEVVLIPSDDAQDEPFEFSLFDLITTAVSRRPEIEQSVLSIDDTSIREQVAENGLLPSLDLRTQIQLNALDDDYSGAYGDVFDGGFVDYLIGIAFEQPIGNRAAEAEFRRRRLERMQAVISYRNTVQQVLLELKTALDLAVLNYRLIEQTSVARIAAAEVLRALLVEKDTISGYTVERLDLELNRQESLASAEIAELRAVADYNIAIAQLHSASGTALERNGIVFDAPDANESLNEDGSRRRGAP
ncbi:MAG: TolC family protein [Planctomycetota bacterium]